MSTTAKQRLLLAANRIASRYRSLGVTATKESEEIVGETSEQLKDSEAIRSVVARFSQTQSDRGGSETSNRIALRQYLASQTARAEVKAEVKADLYTPTHPPIVAPAPVRSSSVAVQPELPKSPPPKVVAEPLAPRVLGSSVAFDEFEITFEEEEEEPEASTLEEPEATLLEASTLEEEPEVPKEEVSVPVLLPVVSSSQIEEVPGLVEDRVAEAKSILDAASALSALKSLGVPVDIEAYCKKFKIPFGQEVPKETSPVKPAPTAKVEQPNAELERSFAERNAAFLADLKDYSKLGLTFDLAQLAALHGVPVPTKKDDLDDL